MTLTKEDLYKEAIQIQELARNNRGAEIEERLTDILARDREGRDGEIYKTRWDYIKADPSGAQSLLLLLEHGKGSGKDFDTTVDRIIESRRLACIDEVKK